MTFSVYHCEEWQCRYVFPSRKCCILPIGHASDHAITTDSDAERASMNDGSSGPSGPQIMRDKLSRIGNIIANLAHPHGDHRQNELEDEAHDLLRELRADLGGQQAAPAPGWQPIDSAPKDEKETVIVFDAEYQQPVVPATWDNEIVTEGGQCWRAIDAWMDRLTPTHWMPLPAPPGRDTET